MSSLIDELRRVERIVSPHADVSIADDNQGLMLWISGLQDLGVSTNEAIEDVCARVPSDDVFSEIWLDGIHDEGIRQIFRRPRNRLATLSLKGSSISGNGTAFALERSPNLDTLLVEDVGRYINTMCRAVACCPKLSYLNLKCAACNDDDLAELPQLENFQVLEMNCPRVSDWETLSQRYSKLIRLGVNSGCVTDSAVRAISGIENLESLALVCPDVSSVGIVELRRLSSLRLLSLESAEVDGPALQQLAGIQSLDWVKFINMTLGQPHFTAVGCWPTVTELVLHKVTLDDCSWQKCAELLRNLKKLRVRQSNVRFEDEHKMKEILGDERVAVTR
ncbi:MAG: hypothetical protein ACI8P0_006278 [Planctomycetaceae bacterium]